MKKKHELIKYAYDNYPKGTKFIGATRKKFTSNGIFKIFGEIGILNDPTGLVYDFETEKWAEIIPESILTGKCAIQVNNEREFKLLMEHYESKGWIWASKEMPHRVTYKSCENSHSKNLTYEDGFSWWSDDYKIIPFKDFAAEVGIEVPVFVMTSEDGVPLYVGDKYYKSDSYLDQWLLACGVYTMTSNDLKIIHRVGKVFSTKEAAESWIKEQNKPKSIPLYTKFGYSFEAIKGGVKVTYQNTDNFTLSGYQVEQMYEAYKSLQS